MPKASAASRARRTRQPRPLVFSRFDRIKLPDAPEADEQILDIHQRASASWLGFGDSDLSSGELTHTFEVRVDRDPLITPADEFLETYKAYHLPHFPDALTDERVLLARLEVQEFSRRMCDACGGWFDLLDSYGDDGRTFMAELVNELAEAEFDKARRIEGALIDGSLFWFRQLGVHPLVRGRDLGVLLMAHALWALNHSTYDLAVLEAYPMKSWFDSRMPVRNRTSVRKLVAHYARLGFQPSRPGPIRNHAVAMHTQFGMRGMPVRGAGPLEVFPKRRMRRR